MRRRIADWLVGGMCASVMALALAAGGAKAQGPATVYVDEARMTEIVETTSVLAQVVATVESNVATRIAGVVDTVAFQVGDRIWEGEALVELDTELIDIRWRVASAALATAEAGVKVAEARARRAEQAFRRVQGLQGSTAFSQGNFEDLEAEAAEAASALTQARARVGEAEAELVQVEYDLTNTTIRAPFGGVVIERLAQPGSYIDTGEPVAKIIDVSNLEIEADMPIGLVPSIRPGLEMEARVTEDETVEATVRAILPVEAISTRTRPVRLTADFSSLSGLPPAAGKSVTLQVPVSAPRAALTILKDALVQSGGGWTVFVAEEGEARPRPVEIGQADGLRIEVLSGLEEGDMVVVRGNERLRPGQPINAEPVEPPAAAQAQAADKG